MKYLFGILTALIILTAFLLADVTVPAGNEKRILGFDMQGTSIYKALNIYLRDNDTNTLHLRAPANLANDDVNFFLPGGNPADQNQLLLSTDSSGNTAWGKIQDRHISSTISSSKILQSGASGPIINAGGILTPVTQLTTGDGGTGENFGSSTGVIRVQSGTMSADANTRHLADVNSSITPQDDYILVYDNASSKYQPEAFTGSGDDSFNCVFADSNSITVFGTNGGMWYNGKEYVTVNATGTSLNTNHFVDITVDFATIPGASDDPVYIYIDKDDTVKQALTGTGDNAGRVVNSVDPNDFYLDPNAPENGLVDLNRYIPICYAKAGGSNTFATNTFNTLSKRNLINWVNLKQVEDQPVSSRFASADQNTPNNTTTPLAIYDDIEFESDIVYVDGTGYNATTGTFTQNPVFQVTKAGKYYIRAAVGGSSTLTTTQILRINLSLNGITSTEFKSERRVVGNGANTFRDLETSAFLDLEVGDEISVLFFQNSGTSMNVGGGNTSRNRFSMFRTSIHETDAIATSLNNPREVITAINNTPTAGKHTLTWDAPFSNNEYAIMINHTYAGITKQLTLDHNKTASTLVIDASSLTVDDTNYLVVKASPSAMNAVLPMVKWQQKKLTSNINTVGTNAISALQFNNLKVGSTYKISLTVEAATLATNVDAYVTINHDGSQIGLAGINDDSSVTQPTLRIAGLSTSVIFTASATTLTFNSVITTTDGFILGTATPITYAVLEEKPLHTETSEF
jgi:hypothetical protein